MQRLVRPRTDRRRRTVVDTRAGAGVEHALRRHRSEDRTILGCVEAREVGVHVHRAGVVVQAHPPARPEPDRGQVRVRGALPEIHRRCAGPGRAVGPCGDEGARGRRVRGHVQDDRGCRRRHQLRQVQRRRALHTQPGRQHPLGLTRRVPRTAARRVVTGDVGDQMRAAGMVVEVDGTTRTHRHRHQVRADLARREVQVGHDGPVDAVREGRDERVQGRRDTGDVHDHRGRVGGQPAGEVERDRPTGSGGPCGTAEPGTRVEHADRRDGRVGRRLDLRGGRRRPAERGGPNDQRRGRGQNEDSRQRTPHVVTPQWIIPDPKHSLPHVPRP